MFTAQDYRNMTGNEPGPGDLDRANCPVYGGVGHHGCGVCAEHHKPVSACRRCFPVMMSVPIRRASAEQVRERRFRRKLYVHMARRVASMGRAGNNRARAYRRAAQLLAWAREA